MVERYSAPLGELTDALSTGDRDPVEYVQTITERIDELDPEINALVQEPNRAERLRTDAKRLEDATDGSERGPLYGIPVGVKDIMHTDGFTTRAGSQLPPELFQGDEATCVERLRDADALIAGKTVTTEFAGPSSPGLTRNPHDLGHTPGGSSSGSAAGVAAGLFPLALGTQTGGSVIRPAAYCGIVGLKPSFERVPRDGVIPRSRSVDHVGMFTQDVPGMKVAAAVLCDEWAGDPPEADEFPTIGLPQDSVLDNATREARDAFDSQISSFENAGYPVKQVAIPTLDEFEALLERHRSMTRGETAMVHHQWFEDYEPFYRTGSVEGIQDGRETTVERLSAGRASRGEFRSEVEDLMDAHGIDLWATPAAPGPAPETIRSIGNGMMNIPWTHAGLPAVTLPDTTTHRLPLGVQLASAYGTDEELLAWAEPLAEEL